MSLSSLLEEIVLESFTVEAHLSTALYLLFALLNGYLRLFFEVENLNGVTVHEDRASLRVLAEDCLFGGEDDVVGLVSGGTAGRFLFGHLLEQEMMRKHLMHPFLHFALV